VRFDFQTANSRSLLFNRASSDEQATQSIIKSNAEKFRACQKFTFQCLACKKTNTIASGFKMEGKFLVPILLKCVNDECSVAPVQYWKNIKNQLVLSIAKDINKYYQNVYVCDEMMCQTRTSIHVSEIRNVLKKDLSKLFFLFSGLASQQPTMPGV
jgi:DNA Polymerase alpha zinc finger